MTDPVVIIGSGLAGYMLAKELRKLDTEVPLIIVTSSDGSFYSKPLLSTALAQKKEANALITSSAEVMAEQLNAEILTHTTVQKIDIKNKELITAERRITYRDCVLACGSFAIAPPWEGAGVSEVFSVNDLAAYGQFRKALAGKKKVAIIGAGLVGCEFANDMVASGFEVHVIAKEAYPLSELLTPEIGEVVANKLEKEGVNWHLEQCVQAINRTDNGLCVVMSDGAELEADVVLSAIGILPNTTLAQEAGIQVNKAIVVDQYLQTSDPHIYALGDCAEINGALLQYVAPLLQSARALAVTLSGEKTQVQFPAMPVAVKTTLCPLVIAPPTESEQLEWKVIGEEADYQALCYGSAGEFIGFILSGNMTRERGRLQRDLPPLM